MILVQASSTPSTINIRSLCVSGYESRNFLTWSRINTRLPVWLLNSIFFLFISGGQNAEHSFGSIQGGSAEALPRPCSYAKLMDSFAKRLFSFAHVESVGRAFGRSSTGCCAGEHYCLRRATCGG